MITVISDHALMSQKSLLRYRHTDENKFHPEEVKQNTKPDYHCVRELSSASPREAFIWANKVIKYVGITLQLMVAALLVNLKGGASENGSPSLFSLCFHCSHYLTTRHSLNVCLVPAHWRQPGLVSRAWSPLITLSDTILPS